MSFVFKPLFFFFTDTATPEIYTLSLHDALPIFRASAPALAGSPDVGDRSLCRHESRARSEEHTSELQSHSDLVCRPLLEKKKTSQTRIVIEVQSEKQQNKSFDPVLQ